MGYICMPLLKGSKNSKHYLLSIDSYLVVLVGPITFLQWLIASSLASIIGIIGPLCNEKNEIFLNNLEDIVKKSAQSSMLTCS